MKIIYRVIPLEWGLMVPPDLLDSVHQQIVEALKTVYDPEIPVDIYELGLIYELDIAESGDVKIDMTLTAPGCPVAGILPQQVADAASSVEGTGKVEVYLVWEPAWDMEKMSEDAKLALGFF
jgi:FeS assembly SUF system protein